MYTQHSTGEIYLWCEKIKEQNPPNSKKKKEDSYGSKRQEKDFKFDKIFEELCKKHGSAYTRPQFKLWARMITNDIHDSVDHPPNVPMITGTAISCQKKKESLSEVIAGAAAAFIKAVNPAETVNVEKPTATEKQLDQALSPNQQADVRMKNFEQLKYLQELLQGGVLTESEFLEQKRNILEALRKLQ